MPAEPHLDLPAGSAPYYVVRFARREHQPPLSAVFAYAAELERSVARCNDSGATQLKFDWWRKALSEPEPSRHPLVRQLQPLAKQPAGLAALWAMLDAAETDILKQQPDDIEAFVDHCQRAGRLANLLCLATHAGSDAGPLGTYAAAVYRIQQLGRRLRQGHNTLPRTSSSGTHGQPQDAAALAQDCRQLLAPLWESARLALRDRAHSTLPARRWANQARAVHRLLEAENYPVHQQHLDITPIAKLWAAWRVR